MYDNVGSQAVKLQSKMSLETCSVQLAVVDLLTSRKPQQICREQNEGVVMRETYE